MRLTELKLPLDHTAAELRGAILKRLGIVPEDLVGYSIFRRSYDARKPSAIVFIYTLDIELRNEAALLARLRADRHVGLTPDTSYHFVARAPEEVVEENRERLAAAEAEMARLDAALARIA